MLFARGVILVEGDAERFLIPAFAQQMKTPLDHLGISVCSVSGTNFQPYVKLLAGLGIPFAVVTDWDPVEGSKPLGYNRALKLVETIEAIATGTEPAALLKELKALDDYDDFSDACDEHGVFTNIKTLEVDLFNDDNFTESIVDTLLEGPFGKDRKALIDEWKKDPTKLDTEQYLAMIEDIGKGRFAQRLVDRISDVEPPGYISRAIKFVAGRV